MPRKDAGGIHCHSAAMIVADLVLICGDLADLIERFPIPTARDGE